jgi:hypothetical protein
VPALNFRRSTLLSSADVLHSPLTTDITSPSPSPPIHHSKDDGESRLRCSMLCRQSTAFLCSAGILDIHLALRSALTAPKPLTLKLSKHVSLQRPTSRKRQVRRPRRNLDTELASHARSRCSLLFRLRQAARRLPQRAQTLRQKFKLATTPTNQLLDQSNDCGSQGCHTTTQ